MSENATFLIDVDVVCYEYLKTDDMGSWRTKGDHIILLHKIIRVMVSESLGLLRYIQPLCIIILIIQLTGTKSTYFKLKDGRVEVIDNKQKTTSRCFCLIRRYYVHGTYQLFKRIIVDIRGKFQHFSKFYINNFLLLDSQGRRNKLAIVQYIFHGSPIKVLVKPHGNSKGKSP